MKRFRLGIGLGAACLAAALVAMPQKASAVTVDTLSPDYILDFPAAWTGVTNMKINFDLTGWDAGDSFQLTLSGSGVSQVVSGAGSGSAQVSVDVSQTSSPFEAFLHLISGSFGIDSVTASANGANGEQLSQVDAIRPTPIPASLPLFLTGSGLVYALVRRRKTKLKVAI